MFSFIRKFLENRRKRAAERDRLCQDLLHRVSKALSDYIDVDKDDKESIQRWRGDNGNLLSELNDIRRFRRSSFYKELKQQNKRFNEFYARSNERIQAIYARERQKQEESRLVSKKLKQLISKQKDQKFKVVESKDLNRKLGVLTSHCDDSVSFDENCPCCGKDGRKKKLYSTEAEALIVAEQCSKERGYPLRVYPCPYGVGFHITSNPN